MNINVVSRRSLLAKVNAILFAASIVTVAFIPVSASAADGQLSVLINGVPPTGFCVAGPITVSGTGVTGQQGGNWHLAIGWGDGTATSTEISGITVTPTGKKVGLDGSGNSFSYTSNHTYSATTTGIRIVLYHSEISGQDGQVIVVNQCVAAPTQGVVILAKQVVNDNLTPGTAVASDFILSVGGNNFTGSTTGAIPGALLNPGPYVVTETGPSGYTQTGFSCTVDGNATTTANNTIDVYAGKNYLCTVTNNDTQPTTGTLTLLKTVVNNNGGTAVDTDWDLEADGPDSLLGNEGDPEITGVEVTPGTYDLSESGPPGYTASDWVCTGTATQDDGNTVTLAAGENAICTITNNDVAPVLTLIKALITNNSAYAFNVVTDWFLSASSTEVLLTGTTPVVSGGTFKAGIYALSESGPTGYTASGWVCDAGTLDGSSLTIGLGETVTCTITNDDIAPTLTLEKTVITLDGGTATEADFQGKIDGTDVDWDTPTELSAGPHTASEVAGVSGYSASAWGGDCAPDGTITLSPGADATCTITNDDIAPGLTLKKVVTTNNGGDETSADFQGYIDGNPVAWNDAQSLDAGTYTITESGPTGYSASAWSCTGGSLIGNEVTIALGETVECTVTNDDIAPTITLNKVVVKDNGGTAGENDFGLTVGGTSVDSGETLPVDANVPIELLELSLTGYSFTSITGDEGCPSELGGTVTLSEGENITCTITNDDIAPILNIVKHVINDNGGQMDAGDFTINVSGTEVSDPSFPGSEATTTVTLDAGAYEVTENAVAGYGGSASAGCSGTIAIGEEKDCVITNDDGTATITIVKNTVGGEGSFDFTVSDGETTIEGPSIETSGNTGTVDVIVDAGTYYVTETVPANWDLTSMVCDEEGIEVDNSDSEVVLAVGDTVTCTFTNTSTVADISIDKTVDDSTPDAGQTITYTLTVTNSGPADATNVVVTDVLPSGVTYLSDNSTTTVTTYASSTGAWTIGTLLDAASIALQIVVRVNSETESQIVTNSASVLSDNADNDDENNSDTVAATINNVLPQCSDGIDNDSDGLIDHASDPGCNNAVDDSETSASPET